MNWVTIIWSMTAAACLALATAQLIFWVRDRTAWTHLFLAIGSVAAAALAFCELAEMFATTPAEFVTVAIWIQVPVWAMVVSLIAFVKFYLRGGRIWLAWAAAGLRTAALVLNFFMPAGLNYREVTGLRHVSLLGETVAIPVATPNPAMLIAQAGIGLFVAYVIGATVSVWRRGQRRRAVLVGGSLMLFVTIGSGQAMLALWQVVQLPVMISFCYLAVAVATVGRMSREAHRSAERTKNLQKKGEWLDLAADSAGAGLWQWDFRTHKMSLTDKVRDLHGLPATGEITYQMLLGKVHPDDGERILNAARKCFSDRVDFSEHYRIVRPDGTQRWLRTLARTYVAPDGQPVRLSGVTLDITEQHRNHDALLKAQRELQAILDGTPSLVYIKDPEGRLLLVNRRFEAVFGRPREELIGLTSHDLLSRPIADVHRAADLRVMATRAEICVEEPNDEPDGRHTYLSAKFPLFEPDGKLYAVCGISTDITERKGAELLLQQQRDELVHLARVTTLSELSVSLAHELNQPLGMILTNAQAAQSLLRRGHPDLAELKEILDDIIEADLRGAEIIRRLRVLLKRGEVSLQPVALDGLISEVLHLLRGDLVHRGVAVQCDFAADLPQVPGDRVQLQQLALNLILNAADAMAANAPGTRWLHLQTARHDGVVRATVRDEGCGLPADVERLFQPFHTTKPSGLGMGLPICRSIIAVHRGRLWAESHPEGGAMFHFELPVVPSTGPAAVDEPRAL